MYIPLQRNYIGYWLVVTRSCKVAIAKTLIHAKVVSVILLPPRITDASFSLISFIPVMLDRTLATGLEPDLLNLFIKRCVAACSLPLSY